MSDQTSKFLAIADCADIYDALCERCSPAMMLRLGRTCRLAHAAMKDYMGRAFDINKHLKRFFSYPLSFRVLQAQTQAIVSGSSALQFMGRLSYTKSDLDIFVANEYAQEVCDWIVYHGGKGYRFAPTLRQAERGILDVPTALAIHSRSVNWEDITRSYSAEDWDFYSVQNKRAVLNFNSEDGNRCVQVIVTHNTPMECVLSFHSTVVMNLITYRAAYSLYPKATFEEGLMLPCDTREVNREPGLRKYKDRGWKFAYNNSVAPALSNPKEHSFILGKRCVGDESTWTIPLRDVPDVLKYARDPLPKLADPISLNTFSLTWNLDRHSFEMKFSILKSCYFWGRYTMCLEALPKIKFWLDIIEDIYDWRPYSENSEGPTRDLILQDWNEVIMNECDCRIAEAEYRACPAFILSFSQTASFVKRLFLS